MTKEWKRIRELQKQRSLTIEDLARAIGISVSTLRNLGSGSSYSRRLRVRINDFFGEEIYLGVGGISGHVLRIPARGELEFSSEDLALQFAQELGGNVAVSGKSVRFLLPTRFSIRLPELGRRTEPAPSAQETLSAKKQENFSEQH